MRRLRRLVHLVLLCPFSKGLQVSGSRPGAAHGEGLGVGWRGSMGARGCTQILPSFCYFKKNSGIANLGLIQPLAST